MVGAVVEVDELVVLGMLDVVLVEEVVEDELVDVDEVEVELEEDEVDVEVVELLVELVLEVGRDEVVEEVIEEDVLDGTAETEAGEAILTIIPQPLMLRYFPRLTVLRSDNPRHCRKLKVGTRSGSPGLQRSRNQGDKLEP